MHSYKMLDLNDFYHAFYNALLSIGCDVDSFEKERGDHYFHAQYSDFTGHKYETFFDSDNLLEVVDRAYQKYVRVFQWLLNQHDAYDIEYDIETWYEPVDEDDYPSRDFENFGVNFILMNRYYFQVDCS